MTIRLGVVGCGWAAGEIARVVLDLPDVVIRAAFDADPARAAAFAERTCARLAHDVDGLVSAPDVDVVYAGLPHSLLAPLVEQALGNGKHVLAEKPLALDAGTARRLGALASERGLKLGVFFELRRSASVVAARNLIVRGEIGAPRLIRLRTIIDKPAHYWGPPGAPNWRAQRAFAGGGVLLMNTIHQIDTLRYITGLEVVSAAGEVATFHAPADVEDAGSAVLRLSNGGIVSVVASAHSSGAHDEETIEIDGTAGRLDLPDPFGIGPLRLYRTVTGKWADIPLEPTDSHRVMLADFLAAIRDGGEVPAGATDAAAALAVVQAIYRAAAEQRTIAIDG